MQAVFLLFFSYDLTWWTGYFIWTFMLFWHSMFETKQSLTFVAKVMINSCQLGFTYSTTVFSLFFVICFRSWGIILKSTRVFFSPKVLITQLQIIFIKILSSCIFCIKTECSRASYIFRNVYQSFNRPFILFFSMNF